MIKPPNAGTLLSPTCVDCRPDSAKRPCKVVNAAKKNVPTHRRDRIGSSVAHLREALSLRGVGCRLGVVVFGSWWGSCEPHLQLVEDEHKMKKVLPDKTTRSILYGRGDWADKTFRHVCLACRRLALSRHGKKHNTPLYRYL